jgi:hypothetical protein
MVLNQINIQNADKNFRNKLKCITNVICCWHVVCLNPEMKEMCVCVCVCKRLIIQCVRKVAVQL